MEENKNLTPEEPIIEPSEKEAQKNAPKEKKPIKKPLIIGIIAGVVVLTALLVILLAGGGDNSSSGGKNKGNGGNDEEENHTHAYGEWKVTTDPTCSTAGEKTRICDCGKKNTESIPATGEHTMGEWELTVRPENGSDGKFIKSCTNCDKLIEEKVITYTPAGNFKYTINADGVTCTVTGLKNSQTNLVLPNNLDGYLTTRIGYEAFYYQSGLVTIELPETLEVIASRAFYQCSSLKSIVIPDSVISVGEGAFYFCRNLEEVVLSKNILCIAGDTFNNCSSLKSINIPDGVKTIGNSAFYDCSSLQSITLPEGLQKISDYAFCYCTSLESINFPEGLEIIGGDAFYKDDSLKNINLPTSLKEIDHRSFNKLLCTEYGNAYYIGNSDNPYLVLLSQVSDKVAITEIHPDTIVVADWAVERNSKLKTLTIPDGVKYIGDYAFSGCYYLNTIDISDNSKLVRIGDSAFDFSIITSINIPDSVVEIGSSAFSCCYNLQNVKIGTESQLRKIERSAFHKCLMLPHIYLPNGITELEYGVFMWCQSLSTVAWSDNITTIGDYAFNGTALTKLTIPETVTSIGEYAFGSCNKLVSVSFGENSQLKYIGGYAFESCDALTTISLPTSLEEIGGNVFYYCNDNLFTVYHNGKYIGSADNPYFALVETKEYYINSCEIHPSTRLIAGQVFSNKSISSIVIPDEVYSIGYYAFSNSSIQTVTISEKSKLRFIGNGAFEDCDNLSGFAIPSKVERIGNFAFNGCNFWSVPNLPSTLEEIGNYAFGYYPNYNTTTYENCFYIGDADNPYHIFLKPLDKSATSCVIHPDTKIIAPYAFDESKIESIVIPDGVTTIGCSAFYRCYSLESVYIPDSVKIIQNDAFENSGIRSIVIPDSVTTISPGLFEECESLVSVVIPAGVSYIGSDVFDGCNLLSAIYYGGSKEEWEFAFDEYLNEPALWSAIYFGKQKN